MKKEEVISKAVKKAKKLRDSHDLNYTEESIPFRKHYTLVLRAERAQENDPYVVSGNMDIGELVFIEPYIKEDGKPVSGIAYVDAYHIETEFVPEINYLVGMYV